MTEDIYVVGASWLGLGGDSPLQLDEAVFQCCSSALKGAGVKRHQVGLTVVSSLDLYDGRSISNALTAPAAAAYLGEELRVEGDAGAAFLVGLAGLASGQTEMAIVVAVNAPEIGSTGEADVRRLRNHVSSYTFDAHMDRPVGLTSTVTLGLHASRQVETGAVSWEEMVDKTALDISRGAATSRGVRPAASRGAVEESSVVAAPLTELMLPAESTGVAAVVIAAGVTGRRCPRPLAKVKGWGSATGPATSNSEWLTDPTSPAARAAADAYRRAGLQDTSEVRGVEMSDLTPALTAELLSSLNLTHLPQDRVNSSGGVRSNYPGLANGLLRIIETSESLAQREFPELAVAHSADDLMGLVSSTASVLVMESV